MDKSRTTIILAVVLSISMAFAANIPRYCTEEIIALSKGNGDMQKLISSLPPAVVKAKIQAKSPFGQPKDSDKMPIGMTFGCLKSFPESPAEIQSLLKDVIQEVAGGAVANLANAHEALQLQPQAQVQPQYTQPPPQGQPQYVYPPPPQGQPQYVYPPPPQGQPQYVYPPPPQGQPQYVYLPQQPQYIYVAQPVPYQQLGNFSTGERWGTWALNTVIPGLGSAAIMNDYVGMGIQIGLTALGITSMTLASELFYSNESALLLFSTGWGLLGVNQIFNIVRSASYNKPTNNYEYIPPEPPIGGFSVGERWGTWALNTVIPGLGSAGIMNDITGMGVQIGLATLGVISILESETEEELLPIGICLLAANSIFNIIRSVSYDKPADDYASNEYSGFNLAFRPSRHGEIMPYLMYSKTF